MKKIFLFTIIIIAIGCLTSCQPNAQKMLLSEIEHPKQQKVDLTPFKDDIMYSATLLAGLSQLVWADGKIQPAEKIYLASIGKVLGYTEDMLQQII